VSIYLKVKFGDWLHRALRFTMVNPVVWFGYTAFIALVLCVFRISYALGIFGSVVCLFVGVGVNKYIDLKKNTPDQAVGLFWAIKKSLPLAIIAGLTLVVCWFIFSALGNILNGEFDKISYFFFDWQYTNANMRGMDQRQLAIFLFGYADVALIFTLLMMAGFANWYSYPLMLFKDYTWSQAKELGREQTSKQTEAYYKTLGFLIFNAVICTEVLPWATPFLYMLAANFIFLSYKQFFERA
jgi:hypothetical protein